MNLFELFVKIGVDDQASGKLGELGGKLGNGLKTAAKVGTAAVATVTAAAGAMTAAFAKGTSELAQYGDNIDKMSQKMGLSAQAYQEWDFIMQHSGTSMEALKAGMKTLANAVDSGNDAFQRLGISQAEVASMNQEELFAKTIEQLQKVENETERTYLAGQLLGRGATELGALLNTSAEDTEAMRKQVHELGGVMSDEAVKAAAAYQDSLQNMQTAFSGIQRGMLSDFLPSMVTVMDGLALIFSGNDSGIEKITEGVNQFADKLMEAVPKIFELGEGILSSLLDAIIDNLPLVANSAIDIIMKLVDGILSALPTLTKSAIEIIKTVSSGLILMLPQIVSAGVDLIIALITGIADMLGDPDFVQSIIDVVLKMVDILTDPDTITNLLNAAVVLVVALAKGLIQALPQLLSKVPEIISNLAKAFGQFLKPVMDIGKNIIDGIKRGISNAWNNLVSWFKGLFGDLIGIAKKILGIHSPSTLFRDEIGKNIALGIAEGIDENADEATKAAADMAKNVYNQSKKWLDKNTKLYKYNAKEQLEVWKAIQDQFIKESKQYADAEEKIFDLRMQIRDEFTSKIKEIFEEISDIEQDYADTLESTTENIASAFGLFEQVEKGEVLSGQQLIKNMQDQITATERFYGALEELSTRGVGDALVDEIREMGMGVADELYALLRLSDEQLTQFDGLFEKKMSLAAEIAEKELAGVRATADAGILGNLQEISALQDEAALYGGDDYEIVEETVEFSQSGLGISSAGVVNGLSADGQTESNQTFKINLVLPDGTPLASYLLDPLVRFANANGTPILNPI